MGDNNKDNGLSQVLVQIFAGVALFLFYVTDKLYHMVEPPLGDMWYAVATGIAVFGRGFERMVKFWFNRGGG